MLSTRVSKYRRVAKRYYFRTPVCCPFPRWGFNNFFNRQSFSDIPPLQNNNSNEIVYLPEHKTELFNDFFVKQSRINNIDDELPHIEFNGITAPTIVLTREMVYKVIKDLDQSKAVGPDLIHNKLLVKSAEFLSEPFTILFNRSIAESRFPYSWKIAHVTPIHKKGDKSICNNYRPSTEPWGTPD